MNHGPFGRGGVGSLVPSKWAMGTGDAEGGWMLGGQPRMLKTAQVELDLHHRRARRGELAC